MSTEDEAFRGSSRLREAVVFAREAHSGPASHGSTGVDHPLRVAGLIRALGASEEIVVTALLHDVVEDSDFVLADIEDRFGARIASLVSALTEDGRIDDYDERKDEHRRRVLAAGPEVATIYLADKLARAEAYLSTDTFPGEARLAHYRNTIELFGATDPALPLIEEVKAELALLKAAESTRGLPGDHLD